MGSNKEKKGLGDKFVHGKVGELFHQLQISNDMRTFGTRGLWG